MPKKTVLKIDLLRLSSQPTHVLELVLHAHGAAGRFLCDDTLAATHAELARRGTAVLDMLGFETVEVEYAEQAPHAEQATAEEAAAAFEKRGQP